MCTSACCLAAAMMTSLGVLVEAMIRVRTTSATRADDRQTILRRSCARDRAMVCGAGTRGASIKSAVDHTTAAVHL